MSFNKLSSIIQCLVLNNILIALVQCKDRKLFENLNKNEGINFRYKNGNRRTKKMVIISKPN